MVNQYRGDRVTIAAAGLVDELSLRIKALLRPSPREIRGFYLEMRTSLGGNPSFQSALRNVLPSIVDMRLANAVASAVEAADKAAGTDAMLDALKSVLPIEHIERLRASMATGNADEVVDLLAKSSDKQVQIRSKIVQSAIGPTITVACAIGTGIFLSGSQLPALEKVFSAGHATLPLPSRIVMGGAALIKAWPILGVALSLLPFFCLWMLPRAYEKIPLLQDFVDRIPVIGTLMARIRWSSQLRTLSMLLTSRLTIFRSLELTSKTCTHFRTKRFWKEVGKVIAGGGDLFEGCRMHQHLMGKIDTRWIEVLPLGASSGNTSDVLRQVAMAYEERAEAAVQILPTFAGLVGFSISLVIVGVVAGATLLPSFDLINVMK